MNAFLYFIVFICFVICLVVISSIVDNKIVKIRTYKLSSNKIYGDCKIAFLSDLHGNSFGDNNNKLISKIIEINPDMILIGGDMITARVEKVDTINWENSLSLLKGVEKYPVYYGIGNHEYRMDIYRDDFNDAFDRYSDRVSKYARVLYNDGVLLENNICIKGLAIDRKYYKRFENNEISADYIEECVGASSGESYNIMLAHNPEYFEAYSKTADLTLSGHVHGGIARVPILGGVVSPRLTLFPKYDGGLFEKNGANMIVSRGLGSHTLPLRLFNPCEICVIELKKE